MTSRALLTELLELLLCPGCSLGGSLTWTPAGGQCKCGVGISMKDGIVLWSRPDQLASTPEVAVRDSQARGYLQHGKFPTQVSRVQQFLDQLPRTSRLGKRAPRALDLACGPGPYTKTLLEREWKVLAVDFSLESLRVNRDSCGSRAVGAVHVLADLNRLQIEEHSFDLLMMCDFLQHLGDRSVQAAFVRKAFTWLTPGGHFYLSLFNCNVVNRLKGDRGGAFAGGAIPYLRSTRAQVQSLIPPNVEVRSMIPMNIAHGAVLDRLLVRIPLAGQLSRMWSMSGRKL